jgi:hypothetical protein
MIIRLGPQDRIPRNKPISETENEAHDQLRLGESCFNALMGGGRQRL